jgi:hypothetical protein
MEWFVMSDGWADHVSNVVPMPNVSDDLDRAGSAISEMVLKASKLAAENTNRALKEAHRLSLQLRVAEDRIVKLEAECRRNAERADRAEKWLLRISKEIESGFFSDYDSNSSQSQNASAPLSAYLPRRNAR